MTDNINIEIVKRPWGNINIAPKGELKMGILYFNKKVFMAMFQLEEHDCIIRGKLFNNFCKYNSIKI